MPVGVVDALEVVEVEEEQAEGSLAVQLALQRLVQVARVVEPGEVVEVGEVLHTREALGVIPGQREVACEVLGGLAHRLGGRCVGHQQGPPPMLSGLAHRETQHPPGPLRPGGIEGTGGHVRELGVVTDDEVAERLRGDALRALQPDGVTASRPEEHALRAGQPEEGRGRRLREPRAVEGGEEPLARLDQREVTLERRVLREQRAGHQRPVHRVVQPLGLHRLDQVLGRPVLDGAHRGVDLVQRGDDHHLHARIPLAGVLEDLHAVPGGEDEVGDHQVDGVKRQRRPRLRHRADAGHPMTRGGQVVAVHRTGDLLVVHQQDGRHPTLAPCQPRA